VNEAFRQRLLAVQERISGAKPSLPVTEDELFRALRKMLLTASDEGILTNEPHVIHNYLKKTQPPPEARAHQSAVAIVGGEKNQHRSKERKHFLRADGAWFDFAITVARSRGGPLALLGYDFEIRFPQGQAPSWIRIDLNLPGHDNEEDGLRSHLHPGNDDLQAPAPVLSPLELLDLFLHGFRGRDRPRRKGADCGADPGPPDAA
jgi:hypothetical protein